MRTLCVAGVCLSVSIAQAQTSEYYVLSGDEATFSVIQNGVLLRQWAVAPGSHNYQYPIAVRDTIRTMGAEPGDLGAEYDFSGNDLGARYVHPTGPSRCWDGTTDGVNNFAIDTSGVVWQLDLDWQNPVSLFDAGGIGSLTYDPTNDSLWVSQFSTTLIREYSRSGVILREFSTGHSQNMALALDHADDTLWLHDRTTEGTYEQWTKNGMMLARIAVAGMEMQNALAGEFRFGEAPCYPDCDGSGTLDLFDFLCFVNEFNNGSPYADCDGSGGLDLFDFLCFVNEFNNGCP
jgi:hypothetical protein